MKNQKYIILVVDDDENVLEIIQKMLSDDHIDVITTTTVKGAFEVIDTIDVQMLITDYYLANGNGPVLIKKLRSEKPHIPVIMISGGGQEVKLKSLEVGANVYLGKPLEGRELKIIIQNLLNLFDAYEQLETAAEMISALSTAVEKKDEYTQGHADRVAEYSLDIYDLTYGEGNKEQRESLRIGCTLHDIGKIGVPDQILKSTEGLSPTQRQIIEEHTVAGYEICKDLKTLGEGVDIIRHHHEKLDGSGYPDGLSGSEIPKLVQIAAIADIYDALTTNRSYRSAKSNEEALAIIKKDAYCTPPKLNGYFLDMLEKLIKENPEGYPKK